MLDTKEDILKPLRLLLAGFDSAEKRQLEIYNTGVTDCDDFYWEASDLLDKDQQQILYMEGEKIKGIEVKEKTAQYFT